MHVLRGIPRGFIMYVVFACNILCPRSFFKAAACCASCVYIFHRNAQRSKEQKPSARPIFTSITSRLDVPSPKNTHNSFPSTRSRGSMEFILNSRRVCKKKGAGVNSPTFGRRGKKVSPL